MGHISEMGRTLQGQISCYMPVLSHEGAPLGAQTVMNLPVMQEAQIQTLGWEDSLEQGMETHSTFLPGEFHGQRSLEGYSP